MIAKLHHNAYRCRDVEETRKFYEDFLGLPLMNGFEITETKTGRTTHVFHVFFGLDDGSCLAFFDVPDVPFDFKEQHDYDLHIALEVPRSELEPMMQRAKAAGKEVRGIANHDFIESIYLRDPNGYVIELTAKTPDHDDKVAAAKKVAHDRVAEWTRSKAARERRPRRG